MILFFLVQPSVATHIKDNKVVKDDQEFIARQIQGGSIMEMLRSSLKIIINPNEGLKGFDTIN